jgi:hypothetical protein
VRKRVLADIGTCSRTAMTASRTSSGSDPPFVSHNTTRSAQLERLEKEMLAERARVAEWYREALDGVDGLGLPCVDMGGDRRGWFVFFRARPAARGAPPPAFSSVAGEERATLKPDEEAEVSNKKPYPFFLAFPFP